jgi:hypothetical protein
MAKTVEKVECATPTPGKATTRIDKWKYDAVSKAILKAVPVSGAGLPFRDLPGKVAQVLPEKLRDTIGSIPWYTTVVKLDMEVRGKLRRLPDVQPQRLLRVK